MVGAHDQLTPHGRTDSTDHIADSLRLSLTCGFAPNGAGPPGDVRSRADALVADPATLPSVALTAWQALVDDGDLQAGQHILVVGAGGVVGKYAIKLAKRLRAHVIAAANPRSADAVLAVGADQVIDYAETDVIGASAGRSTCSSTWPPRSGVVRGRRRRGPRRRSLRQHDRLHRSPRRRVTWRPGHDGVRAAEPRPPQAARRTGRRHRSHGRGNQTHLPGRAARPAR